MNKIVCGQLITFLAIVFSVFEQTYGENDFLKPTNIQNNNPSVLESLIQNEINCNNSTECETKSRRKRFVAFPDGSSFNFAFCTSVGFLGTPSRTYLSWSLNWGVAYDLPNDTWIINERDRKVFPKQIEQRRHRRDLYNRLEEVIDNMGYNGRACVLRALCEAPQYFFKKSTNFVEELVRLIFTLPTMKLLPFEHADLMLYDKAYRQGSDHVSCASVHSGCHFSLVELALGEYSNPFSFM